MRQILLAALAWSAATTAGAEELRRITIPPDVSLDVEIVATEAEGFRVRVPQGTLLIPFEDVLSLETISEEDYAPSDWTVWVVADPGARPLALLAWADTPGLVVRDARAELPPGALEPCGGPGAEDLACVLDAVPVEGVTWVVGATSPTPSTLRFQAVRPGAAVPVVREAPRDDAASVHGTALAVIGLDPDGRVPETLAAALAADAAPKLPRARADGPSQRTLTGLAFVPFPGVPSLARRDWGGFGASLATAAAGTAAWVGATGAVTDRRAAHIGLGVAGAYVLTVATNQVFAHVDTRRRAAVGVAATPIWQHDGPIDGFGVTLVVGAR